MFRMKTFAAAVVSLGLVGGLYADTKPAPTDGQPPAPKIEAAPANPGVLSDASLKEMLEKLGYDVKEEKNGASMIYWVEVDSGGLKYSVSLQVSPNKEKLWFIVPLSDVNEEHLKQADRWVKLTELNDQIGPCYFRYNVKFKRLYMSRPMDNHGVTAKSFRDSLVRTLDRCTETKANWSTDKWIEAGK